ncbi:7-cyano-7-deazaguanine synthase QueC [bacterium]|nr:7-cyano-7-deazaguanine synthase QueC [bacterium]
MAKILVLNSGGLDSTTCLGIAINEVSKENVKTISFDFGQQQIKELDCAKEIAKYYGVENKILKIDLTQIGGSAQTDKNIEVPKSRGLHEMTIEIPVTWTPQRNTIFLTLAHAYAEVNKFNKIFIGANQIDFSGYPDCRDSFFKSLQETLNRGSKIFNEEGKIIKIFAPLQFMNKAAIIKEGIKLNIPYELTWSCYDGKEKSCGQCDSCKLRLNGFKEAGVKDPLEYEVKNGYSK